MMLYEGPAGSKGTTSAPEISAGFSSRVSIPVSCASKSHPLSFGELASPLGWAEAPLGINSPFGFFLLGASPSSSYSQSESKLMMDKSHGHVLLHSACRCAKPSAPNYSSEVEPWIDREDFPGLENPTDL